MYDYHGSLQQHLTTAAPGAPSDNDDHHYDSDQDPDPNVGGYEEEIGLKDMEKAAAIWILKTRECNKLTQTATDNIIQDG